jgi:hypothetical protein
VFSKHLRNVIQTDNWKNPNFLSTVSNPDAFEYLQEICQKGPPESIEEAFDILLNGLVSRFGVIPRQVFRAMFEDFKGVVDAHDSALHMPFEEPQKAADELSRKDPFADVTGFSPCLISLNNVGTLESAVLRINFLSPVIAEKFSKRLWDESQVKARSMIKHFLAMPQTRGLAGSLFEPFAHHRIANPDEIDGTWALRLMSSSDDSNTFTLDDSESSDMVPGFPKIKRRLASFHSRDSPLVHVHEDVYYTPTIINHPLFDSFVIDLSPLPHAQHLWLLQMTTSDLHKGSQKGCLVMQEIVEQIQQQCGSAQPVAPDLKGKGKAEGPLVEVNYVLVRPTGQKEHKWILPEGLEQGLNHQPNVYLLELPLDQELEIDEVQKSGKKRKASTSATRSKRASTSTTTRSKRLPKASTSATTSRRSDRLKKK